MEKKRIDYKDIIEILKELDSSLTSYKNVNLQFKFELFSSLFKELKRKKQ